jgi:cephalosporin-C deacetylase-like acetyl esterase
VLNYLHSTSVLKHDVLFSSCQGQRVEIRFVAAPREEQGQARVLAQRAEKTLRELNEMDPYDFAVRTICFGYRA